MKVGIDITVLYRAWAGVFTYHYRLIQALLQVAPASYEFVLLDYLPLHNGATHHHKEITQLANNQAKMLHVSGLRHRKLSHLSFLQKAGIETAVTAIDKLLEPTWEKLTGAVQSSQLKKHLTGTDIFHSSDVLNIAVPGAKSVTTIHDLTTLILPEYHLPHIQKMQAAKFRFAQEQADAVIAVSENTKQDIVRLLGIEPERIYVVHEGVEPGLRPLPPEAITPTLSTYGLEPESYILHVGTIEPRKNLVRLVEAYHQVRQALPESPKLVLVGRKGWFYEEVYAKVVALDLTNSVLFFDSVTDEELPAFYNGALLMVYPTLYEGFGLPALEAMACGTAVIAANTSSLPEVVGDAGLLVDPKSVNDLANAMLLILEDTAQRAELSQKSLKQAQKFTWEKVAKDTLAIYEKINQ